MAVVTAHVHGSFYGPCSTRPCTRVPTCYVLHDRLHGRIQAVYTVRTRPWTRLCTVMYTAIYSTVCTAVYSTVHSRVHGRVREVYTFTSRVQARTRLCLRPVCTACTWPCTYTAVNRPCTACTRSCTRVHGRVYGPCTRPCTQAMVVYGPCPGLFMRGVRVLGLSITILMKHLLFTARRNVRIASKGCTSYSNSVRLSVRPSVRPSHAGIVSKGRHVARCCLDCRIAKCV